MRRRSAAVLAAIASAVAAAPAAAQDTLTPEGPATLRDLWLGAVLLPAAPDEIILKYRLTVGPGGKPGWIRMRVVDGYDKTSVRESGQRVWLPAEPGTYEFPGPRTKIDFLNRENALAIDQETGGHAILQNHEDDPGKDRGSDLHDLMATDVFRPPLADGA